MPTTVNESIAWFKATFGEEVKQAIAGTPFAADLIVAIAMQETSYLWRRVYKTKSVDEVLALCVGDTIDAPGRSAFPKNRAALEAAKHGTEMFEIARESLEAIAEIDATYAHVAKNPDKFCRGFGMFQYDLQAFKKDPDYFLDRSWATFEGTLGKCIGELKEKTKRVYGEGKTRLTRDESVYVAIAYNKGSADLTKDFRQGYKDSAGKYYGEGIDEYMALSKGVA